MTLLAMYGFDDQTQEPNISGAYSSVTGRGGVGYAAQANASGNAQLSFGSAFNPGDTAIIGFACKGGVSSTNPDPWVILNTQPSPAPVCQGVYNTTTGILTFYDSNNTVLANIPYQNYYNNWTYITVVVQLSNPGTWQFWIEGTIVAQGTNGNFTNFGNYGAGLLRFGAGGTYASAIDDVYIANTQGSAPFNAPLGSVYVRTLSPNGNGSASQWTNSQGNNTDNYTYVDELPSSTTTYVETASTGVLDTYTNPGVPGLVPLAVQPVVYGSISGAGSAPSVSVVAESSTHSMQSSVGPFTTQAAQYNAGVFDTQPDGVTAWTEASLVACQFGVTT